MGFDQKFFGMSAIVFMGTGLAFLLLSTLIAINRKYIKSEYQRIITGLLRMTLLLGPTFTLAGAGLLWFTGWQAFPLLLLPGLAFILGALILIKLFELFFP